MAVEFVRWLDPPLGLHWLDVGTGTGALATTIARTAGPATVVGCDASAPFIEVARNASDDPRVSFVAASIEGLPHREGGYDAVVSGLALNFFPDPGAAVAEQRDALRPGGIVAAYVWDYAEGMAFLRHFWDAAVSVVPEAENVDEGRRFPICAPGALESLFAGAGLADVRVTALHVPTPFESFDDYWRPFLGGAGPAPSFVGGLSTDQRERLVAELRVRLPIGSAGEISLEARAWAVVGTRARG
jgi:SAM-dependent methyltransferase